MANNNYQPWSAADLHRAIRMRRACVHPKFIAATLARSVGSVHQVLHKTGIEFPLLRRGNLIHDKAKVENWRRLERLGLNRKEISYFEKVHPVVISRKYSQEIHNELVF